jgi:hypothetical protein
MYRIWVDEQPLDSVLPMFSGVAEVVGPGADLIELGTCDGALGSGCEVGCWSDGSWSSAASDFANRSGIRQY